MKFNNENKFSYIFIHIFINIKEHSLKFSLFKNICNLIEMINNVIVIDIIFNYKRDFINYLSILYFINPIFYIEILSIYLIKLKINKNPSLSMIKLENNIFKNDQISLLIQKFFNLNLYDQIYYNDYILLKISILVITYLIYYILIIKNNHNILLIIKKICSHLLYFIYKPCLVLILNIFCRKFFFQLSLYKTSISSKTPIDFLLLFLIFFPIIFFYFYFIYAFYKNEKYYFFYSKLFIFEIYINFFGSLIICLRLKIIFSFTLQFIWIFLFFYKFNIKLNIFKYNLFRKFEDFFEIFLEIFSLLYLLIKFIFLIVIKNKKKYNQFKIVEIIILFFLLFILFYFITYNSKSVITLSNLDEFFFKKNIKFNFGLYQLFYLFINFVFYKDINDKERILVINILKKYINKFIKNNLDYNLVYENFDLLKDINNELIEKKKNDNFEENIYNKNFCEFFLILIKKYYRKNKKIKNTYFNDFLFFNKIIIYCFYHLNCYKILYLIKKFSCSKYNKRYNIILISFFYFLYYHLLKYQSSKKIDFSMDYILIYLKINSNYLKFINSFEIIINNFSRQFQNLYEIINKEKKIIQNSKKNLIFLNKLSSKNFSNKNNIEVEKILYIDNLLFNDNFENENFDFNNIKSILDNNNFFILKFKNNNFIIKKIPLNFYENTHIKSYELKNKIFLFLFPDILRTIIHKEIKKAILYKNYNKINTIIKNYNNTISLINLNFIVLPILKDNLYIYCKIKFIDNQLGNCLLIDKLGYIKNFGEFFYNFFCFQYSNEFETNIFNILNLNNINIENIKFEKEFIIYLPKMLKKIKKNIKKYKIIENDMENKFNLLQSQFFNKKRTKIIIEVKNIFYIKKSILYLIIIKFIDLNFSFFSINNKNSLKNGTNTIDKLSFEKNEKSKTDNKNTNLKLGENKWFLQNNSNKKIFQKILELISFIYNFLLIMFAIFFSLYLKKKIKNFISYKDKIYVNRIFNMEFLYLHFYFLHTILIVDENIKFNYDYYTEIFNLNEIYLNLSEYFILHEQDEITYIINYFNTEFQNNIEAIEKNSPLYKKQRELIYYNDLLGNIKSKNYLNIFPDLLSYHFTLSQKIDYLKISIINVNNISDYTYLNNNQKICLNVISNFFPISNRMEEINELIEDNYMNALKNLKNLILFILSVFIIFNFFSIILLFCNIKIINNKIETIIINIQNISNERLNLLKNKIFFCQNFLKNEINNLFINDELNNNNSFIKSFESFNTNKKIKLLKTLKTTKKKKITNNTNSNSFIINQYLNNFHSMKDYDDQLLDNIKENNNSKNFDFFQNKLNNKKSFLSHYNRDKILYITLICYTILFLSIFISSIPVIVNKINKINYQLIYLREIDNIQDNSILYYISIKYNILLNLTEEKNNLTQIRENILINLQKFFMDISIEPFYSEALNIINTNLSCDYLIYFQGYYTDVLSEICKLFIINNTNYYIIIYGLVNILTEIYFKFLNSERNNKDIINYYHNYNFQTITFIYIINILDGLSFIYYEFLYPCFYNRIDYLSNFIFIIFLLLVIIEIIYYYISNFFVLRENTNSIIIYLIIEKFFVEKKNN